MRATLVCAIGLGLCALSGPASAQLASPNVAGVAMGHLHYHVHDVEANRQFWVSLGGRLVTVGTTEAVKFPGVLVFLTRAESSGHSDGSAVNHVAFRVKSLSALQSAAIPGLTVQLMAQFPGVGFVNTPEGERIELFDDLSENVKFTLDEGQIDRVADRHNHPMDGSIAVHHIHLFVAEGAEAKAKAWYAKVFGGVPGTRWHYAADDLPGINMNFSESRTAPAPTKGRMLDHIGFEIRNLEAFCRKLEAGGVKLDAPYGKDSTGIGRALLTDPWGTSIELTEGLNRF